MLEIKLFILTWAVAISAFVYTEILTDSGMILFHWKGFLFKIFKSDENWLYKILVGCTYCVAGQWTLWLYLLFALIGHDYFDFSYDPFAHLFLVLLTIFNVALIKKAGIYEQE